MVAASKSGGSSELELPAAEDFRTRRIPPAVRNDNFRSAHILSYLLTSRPKTVYVAVKDGWLEGNCHLNRGIQAGSASQRLSSGQLLTGAGRQDEVT